MDASILYFKIEYMFAASRQEVYKFAVVRCASIIWSPSECLTSLTLRFTFIGCHQSCIRWCKLVGGSCHSSKEVISKWEVKSSKAGLDYTEVIRHANLNFLINWSYLWSIYSAILQADTGCKRLCKEYLKHHRGIMNICRAKTLSQAHGWISWTNLRTTRSLVILSLKSRYQTHKRRSVNHLMAQAPSTTAGSYLYIYTWDISLYVYIMRYISWEASFLTLLINSWSGKSDPQIAYHSCICCARSRSGIQFVALLLKHDHSFLGCFLQTC